MSQPNVRQVDVYDWGLVDYQHTHQAMQDYTNSRTADDADQIWLVEHPPVFTQGQAGKAEHVLNPGDIPVVQSDRGGQVTYHGPGQLVVYVLIDLKRAQLGIRELISALENSVIALLGQDGISAAARADAPGVYVNNGKIASLGLRVRRGCSFHGLALNVCNDLTPFLRINPCGYAGMPMLRTADLGSCSNLNQAKQRWLSCFADQLTLTLQPKVTPWINPHA